MSEPSATFCLLVPNLTMLSHEEKDALIVKLWSETVALRLEVEHLRNLNAALERRLSELENKLNQPPKDSSNSSIPPSKDRKKNKPARPTRKGVRRASIGGKGGGRPLDPNISEGVLANLFRSAKNRIDDRTAEILERIRGSRLICSDETGVRVNGRNEWEWVFQNQDVCIHVIRPSRGSAVIQEVMAGCRPEIWVSDLLKS